MIGDLSGNELLQGFQLTPEDLIELERRAKRPKRESFVPGPIPLTWLDRAAGAGADSQVVLRLWRYHHMLRRRFPSGVPIPTGVIAREIEKSKSWVRRTVRRLAKAELIAVQRIPGHQVRFKIPEGGR